MLCVAFNMCYVGFLSFFIYFLNKKFTLKTYFLSFTLAIIFAESGLLVILVENISSLGILPTFITSYISSDSWAYNVGFFHPKTIQQVLFCSVFLFIIYYQKIKIDRLSNLIFNMYFMSTILYILFSPLAIFAFRLGSHFYVIEPLLLVMMINFFREKRLVYLIIVFFSIAVSYLNYVYLHRVEDYFLGVM